MLKKLLPLVLLLAGSGAGVGAGIYLRPAPAGMVEGAHVGSDETHSSKDDGHESGDSHAKKADDGHDDGHLEDTATVEYAKLNNQFVVPVIKDQNVAAMVVMTLSLEVPAGQKDVVFEREPKIRDSMLRVLFDHANIGGFDGAFTEATMLDALRGALREVAQRDLGADVVNDVLILEIARQDL